MVATVIVRWRGSLGWRPWRSGTRPPCTPVMTHRSRSYPRDTSRCGSWPRPAAPRHLATLTGQRRRRQPRPLGPHRRRCTYRHSHHFCSRCPAVATVKRDQGLRPGSLPAETRLPPKAAPPSQRARPSPSCLTSRQPCPPAPRAPGDPLARCRGEGALPPAPRPWYGCGYRASVAIARSYVCWDRLVRSVRVVRSAWRRSPRSSRSLVRP